jgi:uncharacterized membrane protein
MSISYFKVQYLHYLIAVSMNVNILFYSPLSTLSIAGSMNVNIIFYSPLSTLSIAGLMNINIIFYSPISTLTNSRINECQYYIL